MKTKIVFMTAMLTLLLCGVAFAQTTFEARGSAIVTGLEATSSTTSTYTDKTTLWLTNISGNEITCKITMKDHDGNDVSAMTDVYTGNNSATQVQLVSSGAGTFTLPAGATRYAILWDPSMNKHIFGHIIIEWDSENTSLRKALMVDGRRYTHSGGNLLSDNVQVNGGAAF